MIFLDVIKWERPELWVLSQQKDVDAYVCVPYSLQDYKVVKSKEDGKWKNYIKSWHLLSYLPSNRTTIAKKMKLYKFTCSSVSQARWIYVHCSLNTGTLTLDSFNKSVAIF